MSWHKNKKSLVIKDRLPFLEYLLNQINYNCMLKTKNTLLLLALIFSMVSCNVMNCPTKESFLSSYDDFVKEIKTLNESEHKNWASYDERFKDFANRCYPDFREKMSKEEKKEFWSNTIKYYVNRYDGDLEKAYSEAKNTLSDEFNQDIEDLLNNSGDAFQLMKELFKDDLKKGLDGILDVLNELGSDLKESLDEVDQKK